MNDNLKELIGEYYSITDNLIVKPSLRAKSQDLVKVSLNEMNSFFIEVEAVQKTMVKLYAFTPEGTMRKHVQPIPKICYLNSF